MPVPVSSGSTRVVDLIKYHFFEKEMGAKVCTLETSAANWQSEASSLTQEVVRRLVNTSLDLLDKKVTMMDAYCRKLDKGGYSNAQMVDIITSRVKGHIKQDLRLGMTHREAWETKTTMDIKKLTGKSK